MVAAFVALVGGEHADGKPHPEPQEGAASLPLEQDIDAVASAVTLWRRVAWQRHGVVLDSRRCKDLSSLLRCPTGRPPTASNVSYPPTTHTNSFSPPFLLLT